jgi:hypothetical protein
MASLTQTLAGAKFYIGGTYAGTETEVDASDFTGETWTLVNGLVSFSAFGDSVEFVSQVEMATSRVQRAKSVLDAGEVTVLYAYRRGDPGQQAIRSAGIGADDYKFRLLYKDGSEELWIGQIGGNRNPGGTARDFRNRETTMAINTNIVEVEPA